MNNTLRCILQAPGREACWLFGDGWFADDRTGRVGRWWSAGDGLWFDSPAGKVWWPLVAEGWAEMVNGHVLSATEGHPDNLSSVADIRLLDHCPPNAYGARLIHIGCGPNAIRGWLNVDRPPVDITRPLPWGGGTVDGLFLEHVIEHVSPAEALRFFHQARRVLKPDGVLRLAFPDVLKIELRETAAYRTWLKERGWADGLPGSGVRAIVTHHGHQGCWSSATLSAVLRSAGFTTVDRQPGESDDPRFVGLESHGSSIGQDFNLLETSVIEGRPA